MVEYISIIIILKVPNKSILGIAESEKLKVKSLYFVLCTSFAYAYNNIGNKK